MLKFFANVFQKTDKKMLTSEFASRKNQNGFNMLQNLPNPDKILRQNGNSFEIYRDLLYDSHVWACVDSRKSGVLSKEWRLKKDTASPAVILFVEELLKTIDIHTLLSDILDSNLFGYQPIEVYWTIKNNYYIPEKIVSKPPEWFCFDTDGYLKFKTLGNIQGVPVPDKKILVPRNRPSFLNPYGESILARCFWSVAFKRGGMGFWVAFTEKYGMPHYIGKYRRGTDEKEKITLFNALNSMVQDAVAVFADDIQIEIKESSGKAASVQIYDKLIDRCNADISKAILGQTLTTEMGSKAGSYAASKTHNEIRKDIVDADKRLCETTINNLIRWACELNFNDDKAPVFEIYEEDEINLTQVERDKTLTETGVKFTKNYYMKTYNLADDDIEIVDVQKNNQAPFKSLNKTVKTFSQSNNEADFLDNLAKTIYQETGETLNKESLNQVLETLKTTHSPEEAMQAIEELYPDMNVDDSEELLTKLIYITELAGMIDNGEN